MIRTCARSMAGVLLGFIGATLAQAQTMELFAGGGRAVDMPGNQIGLQPGALAAAPDGFVYVNDINGKLMRINTATGLVTALPATPGGLNHNIGYSYGIAVDFAGRPHVASNGFLKRIEADGTLTESGSFWYSGPFAIGPDGTVYFVPGDNKVYTRGPSGDGIVIAGGEEAGFAGDGGPAAGALLNAPQGIAVAPNGDVYIADSGNHRIRVISAESGTITTFAGTGNEAFLGNGLHASQTNISNPRGLAFDAAGNLFVAGSSRIWRIDAVSGLANSIAGGGSGGDGGLAVNAAIRPRLVTVDAGGNIYISDWISSYQKIRKIDAATGVISLALGFDSFYFCGEAVPARQACFAQPIGLDIISGGDLLIGDIANTRIRTISAATGNISTFRMTTEAPLGIEHDAAGNIFVASYGGYQVNRYDAITGVKTVVAGGRGYGSGGDGGPATSAYLAAPNDVAIDAAGNLYIADSGNNRIRRVDAVTGIITTLTSGLSSPHVLEFDSSGHLIVAEGCRLRRIDTATGVATTIAGMSTCGFLDPPGGTPATATQLPGSNFAIAPNGDIFLGWRSAHIYRLDVVTGILTRVTSSPTGLQTEEGLRIRNVARMEFDAAGRLYISQDVAPDNYIFRISGLFDSTPPEVVANVSGPAGSNGWYLGNVTVNWSVSDAESAISSSSGCESTSVTEDTGGITLTCSATSSGGTTTQSVTIRKDTVAPAISLSQPEAGRNYGAFSTINAQYTCSDTLSTPVSCAGTVPNGSPLPTSSPGAKTFTVTATDTAGNVATQSRNYSVAAMQFEAWVEPLLRMPTANRVNAGQLVPIRWRLRDGVGGRVVNPAAFQSLNASVLTCQGAAYAYNVSASGGPGLSVNASTGVFTYNWQTTAGSTGCRRVILTFGDNSSREVWFSF